MPLREYMHAFPAVRHPLPRLIIYIHNIRKERAGVTKGVEPHILIGGVYPLDGIAGPPPCRRGIIQWSGRKNGSFLVRSIDSRRDFCYSGRKNEEQMLFSEAFIPGAESQIDHN